VKITIPELSLVVLVGVSGSGKSTFSKRHFKPTEILSSDFCRGLVSDQENNQSATKDAFEVLQFIARKRLAAGKLTVVDATNVQPESRKPFVQLAREFHCLPVAIVLNVPERLAHALTVISVHTLCGNKPSNCTARCGIWNARVSGMFSSLNPRKRSIRSRWNASPYGTTSSMKRGHSTSWATCMAVLMNSSNCSAGLATASINPPSK